MKMLPKNTKKILKFLLRNFEFVNLNQLSKKLKISLGSSFKILNSLEKEGFVLCNKIGNAKYYKIDFENKEVFALSEMVLLEEKRKLKEYPKIYAKEIMKFDKADLIIIFGSVLKNKSFNDVDVLFVTNKIKQVTDFCLKVSKIKTKPVVPLILKKEDLIKKLDKKDKLIINIFSSGVVLYGEKFFLEVLKDVKR